MKNEAGGLKSPQIPECQKYQKSHRQPNAKAIGASFIINKYVADQNNLQILSRACTNVAAKTFEIARAGDPKRTRGFSRSPLFAKGHVATINC